MKYRTVALALAFVACLVSSARAQDPVKPGPGVTLPVVVHEQKPEYTRDALQAKIQGIVQVEVIVQTDGTVSDARVVKSLDRVFGLDEAAVKAAMAWRFRPGMKDGTPVRIRVIVELEFKTSPDDLFARGAAREGMPGLVMPKAKEIPMAKYTAEAMRRRIQGTVEVEAVVAADGTVDRVRVKTSLDATFGLDEEALIAARRATFEPGTLNGRAVPVLVTFKLEFRLH